MTPIIEMFQEAILICVFPRERFLEDKKGPKAANRTLFESNKKLCQTPFWQYPMDQHFNSSTSVRNGRTITTNKEARSFNESIFQGTRLFKHKEAEQIAMAGYAHDTLKLRN